MKHLKWLIALVALLVVPLSIGAPPALAGTNCTPQFQSIYWNGSLAYGAWMTNCTLDTDRVEFSDASGLGSGINDLTWGTRLYPWYATGPSVQYVNNSQQTGLITYMNLSYCGGQVHAVQTFYSYRLHSGVPGSAWGPWHAAYSPVYYINC